MTDFEAEFARRNVLLHALAMAPCLRDFQGATGAIAEASLIRALPSIRPEDRAWVDPVDIRALVSAMDIRRPDLTIAILDALAQVGTRAAQAQVAYISRRCSATPDEGDRTRLLDAANRCMAALREESARAVQAQSLLRGSDGPTRAAGTLLRAARDPAPSAAEELLRASATADASSEMTGEMKEDSHGTEP